MLIIKDLENIGIMSKLVTNIFLIGLTGVFLILILTLTISSSHQSLAQVATLPNSNNSFHSAKDLFVISNPQGYGICEERNSNVFQPEEPFILYVEPVGFAYATLQNALGKPLYSISFAASFIIYDKN